MEKWDLGEFFPRNRKMTHPYSRAYKSMFFIFVIMIYRYLIFSSVYVSWNDTLHIYGAK